MRAYLPALVLFIGGLLGVLRVDTRLAWGCVLIAALLMLLP